jgi:hypothetical protein
VKDASIDYKVEWPEPLENEERLKDLVFKEASYRPDEDNGTG